ncbi:unnamed protein product [Heterobilharzia americana]|nr:unnamed protein product [Heterobilharzia americana]
MLKSSILILTEIHKKHIPKDQLIKITVPVKILNYFTDLSSKSSDIYAKLDAEKLMLTKEKPPTLKDMTWIDYLVLFVYQTIKLLKKCIANLFGESKFHRELQLSSEVEALTHYNLLMYSTEELNVHFRHHKLITENIDRNNYSKTETHSDTNNKSMLETRSRETNILKAYLSGNSKLPGLIYGPAGCGKSSLLRWTVRTFEQLYSKSKLDNHSVTTPTQSLSNSLREQPTTKPIVIVCCVGRTCLSTSLQSLLLQIIEEMASKFEVENQNIKSLCEYAEAVRLLNTMLSYASALKPILIVIDDIEYLYPDEHVQMFHWLPCELPNQYIRIVMTTGGTKIVKGFNNRFGEGCCISLSACFQAQQIINKLLPKLIQENLRHLSDERGENDDIPLHLTQTDQDLINTVVQKI